MERFLIGAAVAVALLIAAGSMFGNRMGDDVQFGIQFGDRDRASVAAKGTGAPSQEPSTVYAATGLKVRDAVAVLKIIPEDRTDVAYEMSNPGALVSPTVKVEGASLVVDGRMPRRIRDCRTRAGWAVTVNGVGEVDESEMPVITVRMPRTMDVSIGNAVKADVGAAESLNLSVAGCGPVTVGDMAGDLSVSVAGSGDVVTGGARKANVSAAGSGDVVIGAVSEKFQAAVAGSGSVTAADVTGVVDVSIAGSGDVSVNAGTLSKADVSIAGSGDVALGGNVERLQTSIMGSGDVTVRGAAGAVDANIMGSGSVRVSSVTGRVQKSIIGAGSVQVGPVED